MPEKLNQESKHDSKCQDYRGGHVILLVTVCYCLKNGKYKVKIFQSLHKSCTTLIVSAEHGITSHILNLKLLNHALNYNQSWKWLLNKFVQCYKNSPKPKRQ